MKNSEPALSLGKIFRSYWTTAKQYKLWLIAFFALSLSATAAWTWQQYIFRDIINALSQVIEGDRSAYVDAIFALIMLALAARLIGYVSRRTRDVMMTFFQVNTMKDLYNKAFSYLHNHSVSFFANNFSGALVKKVNRYVGSFESMADTVGYYFFVLAVDFCVIAAIFFSVHQNFGFLMVGWSIFFMIFVMALNKWKAPFSIKESMASTKVSGTLADTITNALTIKIFAHLKNEEHFFDKDNEALRKATRNSWLINNLVDLAQGALLITFNISLLLFFLHLWSNGLLMPGDIVLLMTSQMQLDHRMWEFGGKVRRFYSDAAYAMEMIEILEEPHQVTDAPKAETLHVTDGRVRFDNVGFWYTKDRIILKDFNLDIKAGEKVALVGHSGAGKSTITKLALRFHDIQKGSITIDGQNIAGVTQKSLRQQLTYVPQEPILFHRTLGDNIRYGKLNATQEQVEEAAQLAHAHEFISKLPHGYNTLVGERGVKLSGGERQRVAIARAILEDAPVLILDEATSSLDSESEKHIQAALHNLMEGKTAVIIAHRLSTIMEMDRIIVMEEGHIIEEGSHQELLAKGGTYRQLWDIQSGGFIGE